jgi:hypothetical protein
MQPKLTTIMSGNIKTPITDAFCEEWKLKAFLQPISFQVASLFKMQEIERRLIGLREGLEQIACTCYLADDGIGGADSTGITCRKPQTQMVCKRCQLLELDFPTR